MNAVPEETPAAAPATSAPAPRFSIAVFIQRFIAGHIFGYPLAFVWAVASMPVAMHLHFDRLEPMSGNEQAMGQYIVRLVAWPAVVVFVLLHLIALVWALAQKKQNSQMVFFVGFGALLAGGVLFGAGSWLWLFLR